MHTFPGPGFYTVCLTVSNAYGSDTKCKVVEIKASSADEAHLGGAYLRVWPNPMINPKQKPPGALLHTGRFYP